MDVVVDDYFDVNLNLNLVATIDDPRAERLTVKGGDQVQVQVHVKAAVHDQVNAHVNENVDELPADSN